MFIARKLLWVDCTAAAIAGVAALALSGGLSRLHVLPLELLLFIGADNLLYGSYSFTLASGAERSMFLIKVLACANAAWSVVCVGLAATFWGPSQPLGDRAPGWRGDVRRRVGCDGVESAVPTRYDSQSTNGRSGHILSW